MKRLLTILTSLLIISVGLLACEEAPTPPPSPRPTIPMATRPAPTPSPTPTSPPTPTPSATARPRAIDAGWPSAAGGPDRARFNPVAHPGQALPLWRLSFQPWGEQAVHPVEVAASPEAVFTIDSVGRVLRVNVQDGGAEAQALLWPYGPRGTVPGAALALTEEVLLVSATDTYFSPQAHLPYFRGKLVAFNAQDLTRLWELPGLFGHNYQIIAQHGQVAVTTDEDTIAMYQARTGQVVWYRQEAYRSRHLLAATGDTLFLRETTTAPPEQRGPYERRQAFVALDWVTGQVRWETRPSLTDDVVGALTDGERLYLLAPPDHLIALDIADGQELWRLDAGPTHERSPIAAAYGKLYGVRLPDQALVAYEAATGRELWRTPLPGTWSTPALAVADGYVYLCEEGEGGPRLIIVDAETGQLVSREEAVRARVGLATPYPGLAIAADRLILAGRDLRAFGQQGEPVSLPPMPSPEFAQPLLPSDEVLYESTELGNGEIWARAADGSQPPRNLTHHGADDWDPAGSPDGTRVAFESYRSGTSNVWVIDRDGEEAIAITRTDRHDIYNLHPTWSPNGEFIAFASTQTGEFQIWVARADGSEARMITNEGENWDPAWSPDGSLIAFISDRTGNPDIWIMSPDGSDQRVWRTSPDPEASPAWSPGCAWDLYGPTCALAFVHLQSGEAEWGELRARLFNGSLEWAIPGTSWGYDRGPAWWPGCTALGSGCWLVWARQTNGQPQLILGDLDGSQAHILGEGKDPSWLIVSRDVKEAPK